MEGKIQLAIGKGELDLKRNYKPSTFKRWDQQADPVKDLKLKLNRPKLKTIA